MIKNRHIACLRILFLLSITLSSTLLHAQQTWQWGARGGAAWNADAYGPWENINDMATDKWGNVYAIAITYNYGVNIDGQVYTPDGDPHVPQITLISIGCDGHLRWFKMITGSQDNEGVNVKTDTLGGVYVAGQLVVSGGMSPNYGRIGNDAVTDTTLSPGNRTMFLAKFDTGGTLKWFTRPEPDSLTYASTSSGVIDMDVDGAGNIYMLCSLKPGLYGGSFVATDTAGWYTWSINGAYLLKYNSDGTLLSGVHLPIRHVGAGGDVLWFKRDHKLQRNYVSGISGYISGDSTYIAGEPLTGMFLACFDDAGHLLWVQRNAEDGHYGVPSSHAALDDAGNIYLTGAAEDSFSFAGHVFHCAIPYASSFPILIKLDTAGNVVWGTNGQNDDLATAAGAAICADTVAVWGLYSCREMTWGGDSIGYPTFAGYRLYLGRFKTGDGSEIALDTIMNDMVGNCYPAGSQSQAASALVADRFGNFYGGGAMADLVYVAGDTLYNTGGETDWFVAKFGTTNCSDPVTDTSLAAHALTALPVKIYPNPASDMLMIDNAPDGTLVKLYNITGVEVYSTTATSPHQAINMQQLASGSYIIRLIGATGERSAQVVVKE